MDLPYSNFTFGFSELISLKISFFSDIFKDEFKDFAGIFKLFNIEIWLLYGFILFNK